MIRPLNEGMKTNSENEDIETEFEVGSYGESEWLITQKTTNLIAAAFIANPDFPELHTLPRFHPTPYNNFGQYYLFDYERFLRIIYDTTKYMKKSINTWTIIGPWVLSFLVLFLFLAIEIFFGYPLGFSFLSSLFCFFISRNIIRNRKGQKYAEFRAQMIRNLLNDTWRGNPIDGKSNETLESIKSKIGTGDISNTNVPILIIFDDQHPFPGYGKLQMDNLFVCRPKDKEKKEISSNSSLFETIASKIKEDIDVYGLQNYKTGRVISIHGDSLRMESKWLNEEKIPKLYFELEKNSNNKELEKDGSSRLFFVVQVLLPGHMTAASFFIRPYMAENAVACQISLATLGPPIFDEAYLLKRLAKYKSEKKRVKKSGGFIVAVKSLFTFSINDLTNTLPFLELKHQGLIGKDKIIFSKSPNIRKISKLNPLFSKVRKHAVYKKEYKKIIEENVNWPGIYYYPINLREENSFTFTSDYFGQPEAIASAKTLYDQISRSVLDSFDGMGYDISDYKDGEGNYSINADKIEKLIVGEKITIKSVEKKRSEKSTDSSKK
ncbi:hypothetical protein [Flagellimonas algicola]|uniref:Uncharacterized protein n=1 Tax=Flagellimonas algicola TaxID=2583815 RepID=A0ABY2WR50_9FLAO|nr:hypothetical protein [Allomuricauda algicola]TMU57463.1 hypothetical protein FGG15_07945 [Allomuricauda algicola]